MKKRNESFFGLHFDFHADPKDNVTVGATLKEEDIREICRLIRPDFIQIDCKGHPGYTSYPSKLGNAMPAFKDDPLALWRKVTKEEDIALYMHYSGIYDIKYASEHENSSSTDATGKTRVGFNRDYMTYADELLIPQISELAEVYGIDGVWIDGDCWAVVPDFKPDSLESFENETGIKLNGLPATPSDPYYHEYREYYKEKFRKYVRHYVDTLHNKFPNLQIASNWAYTDHMPEAVSSEVDFISGDLNPKNSINSARYAARAIAHQGMPWDLMAWNFRFNVAVGAPDKHPAQVLQEAASVISLGGGFQNYIMQRRDGSPNMQAIRKMTSLSEFMREREPYCFNGKPIHQVAMLLSTYDRAHEASARVYSREGYEKQMGLISLLCESGQSAEIVFEHELEEHCSDYPVIVIPELCFGLEDKTARDLIDYAKNGGNLVLCGKRTCEFFSRFDLPYQTNAISEYKTNNDTEKDNGHGTISDALLPYAFCLNSDDTSAGALLSPCHIISEKADILAYAIQGDNKYALSAVFNFGKGKIALVGFDIGSQYLCYRQYLHRSLIRKIADIAYEPLSRIENVRGSAEIVCLEKDGKLMLQIINANGAHADPSSMSEDDIPPLVDIEISVKTDKNAVVTLQPEGKILEAEYKCGRVYFKIDRVDIHAVAQIAKK